MTNTHQTLKVFLACALGAFVGTLVALQLNHAFWFAGLIAGFGVGYVAYEFKKVVAAVPVAWELATSLRINWTSLGSWFLNRIRGTITMAGVYLTMAVALCIVLYVCGVTDYQTLPRPIELHIFKVAVLSCLGLGIFLGLFGIASNEQTRASLDWASNPFRVYLWYIPKAVLEGISWLIVNSPRAFLATVSGFKVVGRFLKNLFDLVHSDIRLLCGIDAAIGAAVGYYFGNALVGAVAGGLWGVFNFEVLSIRVRKLIPIEQSLFRR